MLKVLSNIVALNVKVLKPYHALIVKKCATYALSNLSANDKEKSLSLINLVLDEGSLLSEESQDAIGEVYKKFLTFLNSADRDTSGTGKIFVFPKNKRNYLCFYS